MYVFVGANQFLARTVGAALKTLWRTSGAANTWIPYWWLLRKSTKLVLSVGLTQTVQIFKSVEKRHKGKECFLKL